jgi:hypothetical protein
MGKMAKIVEVFDGTTWQVQEGTIAEVNALLADKTSYLSKLVSKGYGFDSEHQFLYLIDG